MVKERGESREVEGGWRFQCQGRALFNPQTHPFWKWFASSFQHLTFVMDKHKNTWCDHFLLPSLSMMVSFKLWNVCCCNCKPFSAVFNNVFWIFEVNPLLVSHVTILSQKTLEYARPLPGLYLKFAQACPEVSLSSATCHPTSSMICDSASDQSNYINKRRKALAVRLCRYHVRSLLDYNYETTNPLIVPPCGLCLDTCHCHMNTGRVISQERPCAHVASCPP